MTEHNFIDSS